MKPYLLFAVLLVLPLTACESPTAPEATEKQEIPADARVIERIVDYQESLAKVGPTSATVDFAVPELTASAYAVRVYYEEVGTWVSLPYTLAGDYCGDLIDLDYLLSPGTVTFRVTPNVLQPSTEVLPPPTRLKVVIWAPPAS